LTFTDDVKETAPSWSPDGTQIAFTSWIPETFFEEGDVWVMNAGWN
jgi:Tol biopolymer transport system component